MNDASTTQTSPDEAVEVAANLEEINAKISAAARRADRPASDIALVAVSKVQPFE